MGPVVEPVAVAYPGAGQDAAAPHGDQLGLHGEIERVHEGWHVPHAVHLQAARSLGEGLSQAEGVDQGACVW